LPPDWGDECRGARDRVLACTEDGRNARNGTTVRAAGRERRMRATRSRAEPRTPRRRLPGAVRAHDEGGGRHDGRGGTRTGAKSCHRVPGAFTDDGGAVTMNAGGLTMAAAPVTMAAAPVTMTAAPVTMAAAPVTMAAAPVTMTAAPVTM